LDWGQFAEVDLAGLRVDQHLLMRYATFADVKLFSAHVGGFLSWRCRGSPAISPALAWRWGKKSS
jgi:hypothetical protein